MCAHTHKDTHSYKYSWAVNQVWCNCGTVLQFPGSGLDLGDGEQSACEPANEFLHPSPAIGAIELFSLILALFFFFFGGGWDKGVGGGLQCALVSFAGCCFFLCSVYATQKQLFTTKKKKSFLAGCELFPLINPPPPKNTYQNMQLK